MAVGLQEGEEEGCQGQYRPPLVLEAGRMEAPGGCSMGELRTRKKNELSKWLKEAKNHVQSITLKSQYKPLYYGFMEDHDGKRRH